MPGADRPAPGKAILDALSHEKFKLRNEPLNEGIANSGMLGLNPKSLNSLIPKSSVDGFLGNHGLACGAPFTRAQAFVIRILELRTLCSDISL